MNLVIEMKQKREFFLDFLRVSAAMAVVVYHVLGSAVHNDPTVSQQMQSTITGITAALQWHVPVFFMITGFLWLGSGKICTYEKVTPNIRRFILVLFTVGFAYALMERLFSARRISPELFLLAAGDVLTGNLWDHMWYLYSIIGVYLILPVLKPFFAQSTAKSISVLTGLLLIFTVVSPMMQDTFGYSIPIRFPLASPMFYVCAGGLTAQLHLGQEKCVRYFAAAFCGGILSLLVIGLFAPQFDCLTDLLTCVCAVSLFCFAAGRFAEAGEVIWLRSVSDCSFGIYLFHPLFINVMIKVLGIYPLKWFAPVSLALAAVSIIGLSWLFTWLLRKISWIRKYIL